VELIGPNRAGLFINLVPIIGTLLSISLLGEAFHLYHAIALILVLGGIWLAENSGRKRAAAN
jgi:drug/metabolite transporter (DMT)-like permease